MNGPGTIRTIRAALEPHGLIPRGALAFAEAQGPLLDGGTHAAGVLLVGHAGSTHWPAFRAWCGKGDEDRGPDPLDGWSKAVIGPIAAAVGATAFFPSDAPYQPFQQWAMAAEGLEASPLGILIHPVYGLLHGYRGAIAFRQVPQDFEPSLRLEDKPCRACPDKPCLTACPAHAILPEGFQYQPCRSHLASLAGDGCLDRGCLSRNACPVGSAYRYCSDQLRFHMAALKR